LLFPWSLGRVARGLTPARALPRVGGRKSADEEAMRGGRAARHWYPCGPIGTAQIPVRSGGGRATRNWYPCGPKPDRTDTSSLPRGDRSGTHDVSDDAPLRCAVHQPLPRGGRTAPPPCRRHNPRISQEHQRSSAQPYPRRRLRTEFGETGGDWARSAVTTSTTRPGRLGECRGTRRRVRW
jgi:hypothetical protein